MQVERAPSKSFQEIAVPHKERVRDKVTPLPLSSYTHRRKGVVTSVVRTSISHWCTFHYPSKNTVLGFFGHFKLSLGVLSELGKCFCKFHSLSLRFALDARGFIINHYFLQYLNYFKLR